MAALRSQVVCSLAGTILRTSYSPGLGCQRVRLIATGGEGVSGCCGAGAATSTGQIGPNPGYQWSRPPAFPVDCKPNLSYFGPIVTGISTVKSRRDRPRTCRLHPADQRKRRLADGRGVRSRPRRRRLGRDGAPGAGTAASYADHPAAAYATRVVVRRPAEARRAAAPWSSSGSTSAAVGRRAGLDLPRRGDRAPRAHLGGGLGAARRGRGRAGRGLRRRGPAGAKRSTRSGTATWRIPGTRTPTTSTPRSRAAWLRTWALRACWRWASRSRRTR